LHHREMALPALERREVRACHRARPVGAQSADDQDHGIVPVAPADREPLIRAADAHELLFIDALRFVDGKGFGVVSLREHAGAIGARQHHRRQKPENACRPAQRAPCKHNQFTPVI
jgi:hypothetical protein